MKRYLWLLSPLLTVRYAPRDLVLFAGFRQGAKDEGVLQAVPGQVPSQARGQDRLPGTQEAYLPGEENERTDDMDQERCCQGREFTAQHMSVFTALLCLR